MGVESCCVCQPNVDLSLEINYCFKMKRIACGNGRREVFSPYLQGPKFRIGTDHATLHTVLKVKEPEGQLARCIVPG